ncbi:glutathione-dependent formaldehyde-activating enzyme [Daldinia childiae]|uniref:glutathione-dependent formaldehyde-activating enzyme n=1 Tax=Daldinia childiae TaxID=326645 RepID=UPI0014478016|nr:glutathione-dependent formaldehyde-activating enzyme [Daldinia childiae]KAF3061208.1 glutathione-dependent formaldehyde-activating enzyme [Daldinia childiae]
MSSHPVLWVLTYATATIAAIVPVYYAYLETARPSATTPQRYFCGTCGCHVFRYSAVGDDENDKSWEVATGTIIGRVGADDELVEADDEKEPLLRYARHINTDNTKDGGLSPFIKLIKGAELPEKSQITDDRGGDSKDILEAHCHCKTVRFYITRPDASSQLPWSGFSDLIVPAVTSPREAIDNPRDEKWWLRPHSKDNPDLTRYMAGTCACRSCRLAAGFEIQTWAFVPRSNIFFLLPTSTSSPTPASLSNISSDALPLDFSTLQQTYSPLRTYESSPGVFREFCPRCGASVFWHDRWRPDLIDVSVGLLAADEGARAERWLDWWRGRVSFQEDAENGRFGEVARWGSDVIGMLAEGLREREEEDGMVGS